MKIIGLLLTFVSLVLPLGNCWGQTSLTLTLSNVDPTMPNLPFDGVSFYSGTEYGDAPTYAAFTGTGTKSFQIYSPGEGITKTITNDGTFNIRPTGPILIDASKILNFKGQVRGSQSILVKPLAVSLVSPYFANANTSFNYNTTPGSSITIYYTTGAGTYPNRRGTDVSFFKTQYQKYQNVDQTWNDFPSQSLNYTTREPFGFSKGDTRSITATVPGNIAAGTYAVRVVTTTLGTNVISTPIDNTKGGLLIVNVPSTITTGSVNTDVCQGSVLSVPYSFNGSVGTMSVQLLDANNNQIGSNLSFSGSSSPLTVQIPSDLAGTYKVRVNSTSPNVIGSSSNAFVIHAKPTLTLSPTDGSTTFDGNVFEGGTATITLKVSSDSPWSVKYFDPESGTSIPFPAVTENGGVTSDPIRRVYPNPLTSIIYGNYYNNTTYVTVANITDFKNAYCSGTVSGSVNINVKPLVLTTGNPSQTSICSGTTISIPITTNGTGAFRYKDRGASFVIQLLDNNGNYKQDLTTSGGFDANYSGGGTTFMAVVPGDLANGTYKTRVFFKNGKPDVTGSVGGSFTFTRIGLPTATSPDPVCVGAPTVQLTATGTGTINWYDYQFQKTNPVQPTTVAPNDYTYYVSQTVNGCESDKVKIIVTIKPTPAAPQITSPAETCQGGAAVTLAATGSGLIWKDSNGSESSNAPVIPATTAGTFTYRVRQAGSGCTSPETTTTFTVKSKSAKPTVTDPKSVCQLDLNAPPLTAGGTSLKWYSTDQGGSEVSNQVNTDAPGDKVYYVSQNTNGCESDRAKITQTIKPASVTPTVASPILFCRGKAAGSLSSAISTIESPKWYDANNALLPNSGAAPTPNTDNVVVITYKVTQTQAANGCESAKVEVKADIRDAPAAPTVTPVGLCQGGASTTLTAGAPGAILQWYLTPTGGPPIATPVPSTTQTGDQTYYVSQSFGTGAGACESPTRAALKVTINPIPDNPTIKQPNAVCQYVKLDNTGTAAAVTGNNQNLKWYVTPQSTSSPTAPAPATDLDGPQSFSVTQTVNGCESQRATVTITVNKAPTPPGSAAATDLLRCSSDSPRSLSATAATGSKLYWYSQASAGNILPALASALPAAPTLPDPAVTVAPNTTKVYVYYVTQVDSNGCQSLQQPISATIAGTPTAPGVTAQLAVCQNIKPQALTASVLSGATLYWNGPNVATDSQTAPTPPTNTTAVLTYTVRQQIGSCKSPTSTISYTVRPLPSAPTVQSPRTACINSPAFSLSAMGQNLKWYTDTVSKANPQTQVPVSTNTASTKTWFVSQTDVNNCESAFTPLVVRVLAQATARLYGDEKIDLYDSTAVRIQFGGEGPWSATLMGSTLRADSVIKVITKTLINPTVVWVRPKLLTTTYTLTGLINDCGTGAQPNTYLITAKTPTAVNPVGPAVFLTASPNPASNLIQVDWAYANNTNVTLRVLSATGSVLWQTDRVGTSTTQTESIRAGNWPAGLYILQLQAESGGMLTRKLVKQ